MTREHLEELLIDRELGALPPAVGALLETYLRLDPAAQAEAERWREATRAVKLAVLAHPFSPAARRARAGACRAVVAVTAMLLAAAIPFAAQWFNRPAAPPCSARPAGWIRYSVAYDPGRRAFEVIPNETRASQ